MNCIIVDDDTLSRKGIEKCIEKVSYLNLLQSFSNPMEGIDYIKTNPVDLVFLDIEMPEMTGIEFINVLQSQCPLVILTTSRRDFAPEAFAYNVTYYLLKPVEFPQFVIGVTKASEAYARQTESRFESDEIVFVKKGKKMIRISKSDIIWVEALGDYVVIHTEKDKHILQSTMAMLETKLPSKDYLRVHRSYIIRIDKIDMIEDATIYYKAQEIPIGKSYYKEVMAKMKML